MHVSTSICASAGVMQPRSTRDALYAGVIAQFFDALSRTHIYASLWRQATHVIEVSNIGM